jgi:hypothetical protein
VKKTTLHTSRKVFAAAAFFAITLLQGAVAHAQNISTVAGSGTSGYNNASGPATATKLDNPADVIFDASGNLYIADQLNGVVRKVDASGNMTIVAGSHSQNFIYNGDGGQATAAGVSPAGIALDPSGNLYIVDQSSNVVRKVTAATGVISTVAGNVNNGGASGYGGDGGSATSASVLFTGPVAVACDASGNLYIADQANSVIRKVDAATGNISTVAGQYTSAYSGGYTGNGGPATAAKLYSPASIAFDASNNMYIADQANNVIRKVDAITGNISTVAGTYAGAYIGSYGGDGFPATATTAALNAPSGITFDASGNMFISDQSNNVIRKVSASGILSTVAGNTNYGFAGDNGPATAAEFASPAGIACDASGNVYIADEFNNRVREVTAPCSSVTAGSITSSGAVSFCTSGAETLKLIGATTNANAGSITYQWQSSANGSIWANVGADTTVYATGTLTATTYYRNVVTCTTSGTQAITVIDTITVNTPATPVASISSGSGSTICAGANVTFMATATSGGAAPTYQWTKNNIVIGGATGATYSDNGLVNNDAIACTLTSNATCLAATTVTSNTITMTVTGAVTPTVNITSGSGNAICSGASVIFTAIPDGGGSNPTYQWENNSLAITGATANTYTDNSVASNDVITCVLTSNATCAAILTANSNPITMAVTTNVTPTVGISASVASPICAGTAVAFTAIPTNEGANPSYQWTKNNGTITGATTATYTDNDLNNNDVVACTLISSATCAVPANITSNGITMTVNPLVIPAVSITADPGNAICAGTPVTFTATTANGGTTPAYSWTDNGATIPGATTTTYTSAALNNGDAIACILTSNATCATITTANSDTITMAVTTEVAGVATLPYFQGFENWSSGCYMHDRPDTNWVLNPNYGNASWRRDDQGADAGWANPAYMAYSPASVEGAHSACFHSNYATLQSNSGDMDLHIDLSSPGTKQISFAYINPDSLYGSNLTIQIDTDGTGQNFFYLGIPYFTAAQWTQESVLLPLTTATSAASIIRFQARLPESFAAKDMGIDSLYVTVLPPCDTVTGLTVTGITESNATISWAAMGGSTGYGIVIDQTATAPAVSDTSVTTATYTATGLSTGTTYYAHILDSCGAGYTSSWATVAFTTLCDSITGLAVNNVTSTGATVNWNALSGTPGYEVVVSQSPTTPAAGTGILNNTYAATGLTSATTYHVYVRDSCGSNAFSLWDTLTFSTQNLGVAEINGNNPFGINAYPNPTNDVITVSTSGQIGNNRKVSLTDVTGRTISMVDMPADKVEFNMSNLAAGIYLIRYEDDAHTRIIKVNKQ